MKLDDIYEFDKILWNFDKILMKFWWNFDEILTKFWRNLTKCWWTFYEIMIDYDGIVIKYYEKLFKLDKMMKLVKLICPK